MSKIDLLIIDERDVVTTRSEVVVRLLLDDVGEVFFVQQVEERKPDGRLCICVEIPHTFMHITWRTIDVVCNEKRSKAKWKTESAISTLAKSVKLREPVRE